LSDYLYEQFPCTKFEVPQGWDFYSFGSLLYSWGLEHAWHKQVSTGGMMVMH
jgi:hypothetical protein